MINNSKLLIDRNCPMCRAYGHCFVRFGLIHPSVLNYYQDLAIEKSADIDLHRAKIEIALLNTETGKTRYGIDAFIEILTQNRRFLRRFLQLPVVIFILRRVYALISYNRHVITRPSTHCEGTDCTPPLHRSYRLIYLLLTAFMTGAILSLYSGAMTKSLGLNWNPLFEYLICGGQIIWQGAFVSLFHSKRRWDYLGHMSTISLIGGLLLLPPLLIGQALDLPSLYFLGAFLIVVLLMLQEHLERTKNLGISPTLTLTWVAYRLIILTILCFLL
jgi:hypothetical protein